MPPKVENCAIYSFMNRSVTKKITGLLFALLLLHNSKAQENSNNFVRYYPIGEDPNICYKTSYVKSETILFEANPNVRYSFYNNILRGLMKGRKYTQGWFLEFRPQIRMYVANSYPVRMPSYRIFIGTQHMFRLSDRELFAFSIESGHYSNGQNMSALSDKFADGSPESDSLYRMVNASTNLSKIINRYSGNFSTNLVEIILNYRINRYDKNRNPYKVHSFKIGTVIYQRRFWGVFPFGSYSKYDLMMYGKYRYLTGYEYIHVFKKGEGKRISIAENIELIQGAQASVNPIRCETTFTVYPFIKTNTLGFFISYIYGHDNYNLRFVDSGHQVAVGFSWSQFPPFQIKEMVKE